jgi:hypothetical protein
MMSALQAASLGFLQHFSMNSLRAGRLLLFFGERHMTAA